MTRSAAQNSTWARVLVFVGLALWLVALFLHQGWMLVAAAVFTVIGAGVYWYHLRQPTGSV